MKYYYQKLLKDEYLKGAKLLRYLRDEPLGVMDFIALRGFNIEMQLLNSLRVAGIESDLVAYPAIAVLKSFVSIKTKGTRFSKTMSSQYRGIKKQNQHT
ncbi:MAG: hypothetical protein OXC92_02975 [Flavobacteriaceae bacterium]|nr:hypothetical protein [Flavobacteriaceae bacterium]MCY4215932.1 hypothetical protein [Flavobacteriaceae bacterium]MCY4254478.1 hypothetical protein [Flavobacteriaceae bacterium]